jgi:hypothetical protein
VRNNEFSKEHVPAQGIDEAHAMGKLFFLASNIAAHNNKLKTYIRDLEPIIEMGPDALIMMVRERWPGIYPGKTGHFPDFLLQELFVQNPVFQRVLRVKHQF